MRISQLGWLITIGIIIVGLAVFFQQSSSLSADWLWQASQGGSWLLPLIVASALADSINPCAFSILIVSLVFLVGLGHTGAKLWRYGLVYIAGIFIAYLLIGLGLLQALHIFGVPHFMSKVGAILLLILGAISILGAILPKFPIRLGIPANLHHRMSHLLRIATVPAMLGLGLLVGLCEFPCTGGPYLAVIGLLHDLNTYWRGVGYLVLYNVIFILPLIVLLAIASHQHLLNRVRAFQASAKTQLHVLAGGLMIILGLIILML